MKRRVKVLSCLALSIAALTGSAMGYVRSTNDFGHKIYWPNANAELQFNITDIPAGSQEDQRLRDAITEWNRQTLVNGSVFSFSVRTGTTRETSLGDGTNAVGFEPQAYFTNANFPLGVIGVTWDRTRNSNGEIVETDIIFLDMSDWAFDAQMSLCGGGPNFKEVAIHELGHALGLDHENDVPCIMNSVAGGHYLGESRDIMPNADDLAGLRAIYPLPLFSRTDLAAGIHSGHTPPTWLRTGDQFHMPYVVHNLGSRTVEDVTIGFYLSSDRNLTPASDILLGSLTQTIGGGEELVGRLSLLIPERQSLGDYFLGYVVDPADAVDEFDEGNNRTDYCRGVTIEQGERVFVRIAGSPSDVQFAVDGSQFTGSHELVWKYGTQHTLVTDPIQLENGLSRFQFINWGNSSQTGSTVSVTALRNTSYVAQFAKYHFLEVAVVGPGSINIPSGWYRDGNTLEITASANTVPFSRWEGSGDGSYSGCLNPATIVMDTPIIQRAVFESNPQTVQVELLCNDSNGKVLVNGDTLEVPGRLCQKVNSELVVQVLPVQGNREGVRRALVRWSDGDTATTRTFNVGQLARNLSFEYGVEYFLTMEVEGVGTVTPGSGWIDSAASVNIVASSFCGSTFDRWEGKGRGSYDGNVSSATIRLEREPILQVARFTGGSTPDVLVSSRQYADALREPSWGDYDSDGDLDLFLVDNDGGIRLYRHDANDLTDVTDRSGLPIESRGVQRILLFDQNVDGHLDIYIIGDTGNRLFVGSSSGVFLEQTPTLLRNEDRDGIGALVIDLNRDGMNDLLLANQNHGCRWLRRINNGSYSEMSSADLSAVSSPTRIVATDYNRDGYADLYVLSYDQGNRLLRNDHGFGFTDVTDQIRAAGRNRSTDADFEDFDRDGYPDLLLTADRRVRLYRNVDGDRFEEESITSIGIEAIGAQWVDFDNDGVLDIIVIGSDDDPEFFQVLQGTLSGDFERLIREIDIDDSEIEGVRQHAIGDVDNDGDIDAFITFSELASGYLLRTENACNNHLTLQFRDATGLGTATGFWISVESDQVTQRIFVDDGDATIGLSAQSSARKLVIEWPNAPKEVFANIAANQTIKIAAPVATAADDKELEILPTDFELGQNFPNPFNPETMIAFSIRRPCHVQISIVNVLGQRVATLVDRELSAGEHQVRWLGNDDSGRNAASGVYFYQMEAENLVRTRKMILLR